MPAVFARSLGRPRFSYLELTPYKPGIEAAGHGCVISAFDDGPAIREKGHLIRIAPEFEHESIMFDRAVSAQLSGHLRKVYGPVAFMDLD